MLEKEHANPNEDKQVGSHLSFIEIPKMYNVVECVVRSDGEGSERFRSSTFI